jgi:glycosyltransferase involved in cell wall biosynthesis
MASEESVSVVIPTYNGIDNLPKILPLFARQNYPLAQFEVIVVNDGSTDETKRYLEDYRPPFSLKTITHEKNRGRASARNSGIKHSRGAIIIMLDDDMSFGPNFILSHVKYHLEDKRLGVLGMVKRKTKASKSAFIKMLMRHEAESIQRNTAQKDNLFFWGIATGNFSISKEALMEVGLFDEGFCGYGAEDWELGYRLRHSGVRFIYAPDALSEHDFFVDTFMKLCRRKAMEGYSAAYFFQKHPELSKELEVGSVFLFRGSTIDTVKKILKGILLNRITVSFWHGLIFLIERLFGIGPDFLYQQVGAYYYRRGLKKALKNQGHSNNEA